MDNRHRNTAITLRKVETDTELKTVHHIRHLVFVVEQKVDENIEYEFEEESNHFIAFYHEEPAGTARWRFTEKGIKFERFAVLNQYRNKGIGSSLLEAMLRDVPTGKSIYLHAQLQAMNLYAKQGFKPEGELFYEADMPHYKMIFHGVESIPLFPV